MKRTPLYDIHVKAGGNIIDFGGWELPVQYTGIIEEHLRVRNAAGLFDVSHMGEITIKGCGAEEFIQQLVTNDISKAKENQVIYSPMCYPDGGTVDDLLVYKYNNEKYLLVVNASNTDKDFEWIKDQLGVFGFNGSKPEMKNISDQVAQLSIQGPKAEKILQKLVNIPLGEIKFFHFKSDVDVKGINTVISRTGYTGEDGFEIYANSSDAIKLWEMIMEEGKDEGIIPVGLGARDSLRFEATLPLYGHEMSPDITPLEAGLNRFVKLDKEYFTGIEALRKQSNQGLSKRLVGFEMIDRGIARSHFAVQYEGKDIGVVTSGGFSPSSGKNLGLALIASEFAQEGTLVDIIIRNKPIKAKVIKTPFQTKNYKK